MPWSLSNVDFWTPAANWGHVLDPAGHPIAGVMSASDQAAIKNYLTTLYGDGTTFAATVLNKWADPGHVLHIAQDMLADSPGENVPATQSDPFVVYNLSLINQLYYINDHGSLVQERPALSVFHELSHLIDHTDDPVDPNGATPDSWLNQAKYDFKGGAVTEQNQVALELGYINNVQASYQATVLSTDARFGELQTANSYTFGNHIDDAQIGSDGPNNMDHSLRDDNSSDLFLGLGGNDKLVGGGGTDYLYGGAGNDLLVAGSNAASANNGLDYLDGGPGDDLFDLRNNPSNDKIVESGNFGHDEVLLSRLKDFGQTVDENTWHDMTIPNGMPAELDLPDITQADASLYFVQDHKITEWNHVGADTPNFIEQTFTFGALVLVDNATGSSIVLGDASITDVPKSPDNPGGEYKYFAVNSGGFGTVVFKDGAISEAVETVDLLNNASNTDAFSQWVASHLKFGSPPDAFGAEGAWGVSLHSGDVPRSVNYDLYNRQALQGPPPAPDGTPGAGAANSTSSTILGDGSTLLARYDASGQLASVNVTQLDGSTDAFTYSGGALTQEVVSSVGQGRAVFAQGITGQSYTAEERDYDTSGALTDLVRSHADGTPDYVLSRTSDGGQTAIQYDTTGSQILTRNITAADGSRDSFAYTAGALTRETQTHADGSKDVYLSNITGQSYASEHKGYNAAVTLVEDERGHADGSPDYSYTLGADGVVTKIQYDSTGADFQYQDVLNPDGSSDDFIYTAGLLTKEVRTKVDGSKDVFLTNISGKTYTDAHVAFDVSGAKLSTDETMLDGSHHQFAWTAGVTLISKDATPDTLQSSSAGGDAFVFHSGFGGDTLKGFHLDSDQIQIDGSLFASVDDMLQNHTTDVANGALIQDGLGDSLLIQGVTTAQLLSAQHDFLFL